MYAKVLLLGRVIVCSLTAAVSGFEPMTNWPLR